MSAEPNCCTPEALYMRIVALERVVDDHAKATSELMAVREQRYMDLFASHREATELSISASERAVAKSEASIDHRFSQVNEFRGAMSDLIETMLPKAEYERYHSALVEKVNNNAERMQRLEGSSAGTLRMVAWGVISFGGIVAIASLIIDLIVGH